PLFVPPVGPRTWLVGNWPLDETPAGWGRHEEVKTRLIVAGSGLLGAAYVGSVITARVRVLQDVAGGAALDAPVPRAVVASRPPASRRGPRAACLSAMASFKRRASSASSPASSITE